MKDDEEEWNMLIIKNLFLHKRIKCEQIANGVFDFLDRLFSTYDIAQPLKLQVWLIKKTLQHFFCKVEDALFWHCMSWPQPSLFLVKWFQFFTQKASFDHWWKMDGKKNLSLKNVHLRTKKQMIYINNFSFKLTLTLGLLCSFLISLNAY